VGAIFSRILDGVALFAEGAPAGGGNGAAGDPTASFLQSPIPLLIIIGLTFYFIIYRPMAREKAQRREMLAAIKKNDRVLTAGGIYGIVTNVNAQADEVTVKVDETTNTKLRMTLSSVSRVLGDEPSEESVNKS
jgi:preprotein translocase subunit YajC